MQQHLIILKVLSVLVQNNAFVVQIIQKQLDVVMERRHIVIFSPNNSNLYWQWISFSFHLVHPLLFYFLFFYDNFLDHDRHRHPKYPRPSYSHRYHHLNLFFFYLHHLHQENDKELLLVQNLNKVQIGSEHHDFSYRPRHRHRCVCWVVYRKGYYRCYHHHCWCQRQFD